MSTRTTVKPVRRVVLGSSDAGDYGIWLERPGHEPPARTGTGRPVVPNRVTLDAHLLYVSPVDRVGGRLPTITTTKERLLRPANSPTFGPNTYLFCGPVTAVDHWGRDPGTWSLTVVVDCGLPLHIWEHHQRWHDPTVPALENWAKEGAWLAGIAKLSGGGWRAPGLSQPVSGHVAEMRILELDPAHPSFGKIRRVPFGHRLPVDADYVAHESIFIVLDVEEIDPLTFRTRPGRPAECPEPDYPGMVRIDGATGAELAPGQAPLSSLQANVERFSGFADCYDDTRPRPPAALVDVLTQLARAPRPRLVVDLGSGTGLSTRIWAGRADAVVGIEPNADMRREAEKRTAGLAGIRYQEGLSTATGLPDACADIVTISQALHWMEPAPTLGEVARILRPGGVFAAIDCDWPPTMDWEVEEAYQALMLRVNLEEATRRASPGVRKWGKGDHLTRMQSSGQFRYVKEVLLHQVEQGDAERLVGLARSQGSVAALLRAGLSDAEIGLEDLRAVAQRVLGDAPAPWFFSYRVRVGVK